MAGKSIKEIAKLCGVAVQSVWEHQQHILSKFDVKKRGGACAGSAE